MITAHSVVIVGSGHAGTDLAAQLRRSGFDGAVTLIGDETVHPYHRPPLSKEFLGSEPRQCLRDPAFYAEQRIDLILGDRVEEVDRPTRTVGTSAGRTLRYDHLVLATGAEPRALRVPGSDLAGVQTLRSWQDCERLRRATEQAPSAVIVGGGYVGLEVAAVLRAADIEVTLVERESRLLSRTASAEFARRVADLHTARGTRLVVDARVTAFSGRHGRLEQVVLADGTRIDTSLAVVGVGAVPRQELATAMGLVCDDGILVDEDCRTSDPHVLAIGDVTRRHLPGRAVPLRLESIPSATEQARAATATILGAPRPNPEVAWFWSDQFDLKVKIAGVVDDSADIVVRGSSTPGSFALFHLTDGQVTAAETANRPRDFMLAKRLIAGAHRPHPHLLSDESTTLADLIPA